MGERGIVWLLNYLIISGKPKNEDEWRKSTLVSTYTNKEMLKIAQTIVVIRW